MEHAIQDVELEQTCEEALAWSACYGILALALEPPSEELLRELRFGPTRDALLYATTVLDSLPGPALLKETDPESLAVPLRERAAAWLQTFSSLSAGELLETHGRLFGHTARGEVCPYETEYGAEGLFQQPRRLALVSGFYRAFGLKPRETERERADHMSCELEFLSFLHRKEAYANRSGDEETLRETRRAIALFLRDHVARFGRAFARRLAEQDAQGYFGKWGELLFDFLTLECRRLRIEPGPATLRLRSAEEDAVPMACGGDSELVQIT